MGLVLAKALLDILVFKFTTINIFAVESTHHKLPLVRNHSTVSANCDNWFSTVLKFPSRRSQNTSNVLKC